MNLANPNTNEQALWRYGMIAPMLHRPSGASLSEMAREIAAQTRYGPSGEPVAVSAPTLLRWFRLYEQEGLDGLSRQERSDRGRPRALSESEIASVLDLASEHPQWTIKAVHREAQNQFGKPLPVKALYRLLKGHGKHAGVVVHPKRPIGVPQVLWLADTWYGPVVYGPRRRAQKTYLLAFLDDASRAVMAGQFFFRDDVASLVTVFRQALLSRGAPNQIITDNGANYRSRVMRTACAKLKIHLIHAPKGQWSWKARLERFNLTVKLQLVPRLPAFPTMQDLQTAWARFQSEYHVAKHKGLSEALGQDTAPLDFYLGHLPADVRQVSELSLDDLLQVEETRRVNRDGTIRVAGRIFEIREPVGRTTHVSVRFNPANPVRAFYRPLQDPRASFREAFPIQ